MSKFHLYILVLIGILLLGVLPKEEEPVQRPLDTWVFKTVLDDLPGAVVVALHEHIWVAYNPQTADLYRAWRGKVLLKGAVYTGIQGEQPKSDGFLFLSGDPTSHHWKVEMNGKEEIPKVSWKGYRVEENTFTAMYELTLADGQTILIDEQPEYVPNKKAANRSSFQRKFILKEAPGGCKIKVRMSYDGMVRKSDIQTNSKFVDVNKEKRHFDWGTLYNFEGDLLLDPTESTILTLTFTIDPEKDAATSGN